MKYFAFVIALFLFYSCQERGKAEMFNAEKPYTLEIKKERSYFQAQKIATRLKEMGINAYVIEREDSVAGKWFYVLSGALENTDSVVCYKQRVEKEFRLTELQVLNYNSLDSVSQNSIIHPDTLLEKQRIIAERPQVPDEVYETIKKFPHNNSFYLNRFQVVYFPENNPHKGIEIARKQELDLSRGISLNQLATNAIVFSEVVFIDNLYGDRVTLEVVQLNAKKPRMVKASLAPDLHEEQFSQAEKYADMILESGQYEIEEKAPLTIHAYVELYGYRVTIKTQQGILRSYYVLVDENSEYIYFSQSTEKTEQEILKLLSEVGKGEGLLEYDEFYNSFYVIPDQSQEQEIFLGLCADKLSWQYAKAKNYAQWAQKMVGHWVSTTYFYHTQKGIWQYSIFDLLTEEKQEYIYRTLYSSRISEDNKRTIYGTTGNAIYSGGWFGTYLSEINFGRDRFICALSGTLSFGEQDLIIRGESIQFKKGGYSKEPKPEGKVV